MFDLVQNQYRVVANPNANDLTSQGVQSGQYMVDLGVSSVVAGTFDPDALQTLHTLRINVYAGVTGSVQDILNLYASGQLMPVNTNPAPVLSAPAPVPGIGGNNPNVQAIF